MLAKYRCRGCKRAFQCEPHPLAYCKCGSRYFDWENYAEYYAWWVTTPAGEECHGVLSFGPLRENEKPR